MTDEEQEPMRVDLKVDLLPLAFEKNPVLYDKESGEPMIVPSDESLPFSFIVVSAEQASLDRQERLYKARAHFSALGEREISASLQVEEALEYMKHRIP